MTFGQPQPLEGGHVRADKPEDQLLKKASDKLQGAVDKPGVEHLNEQVKQEQTNRKDERNQTLAEQIEKTGQSKIGVITQKHGQSIEITDGDQVLVKGRSKEEVAAALKEMQEASEKDMKLGHGGKFFATDSQSASVPEGMTPAEFESSVKQIESQLHHNQPALVAYDNATTTSDSATPPAQVGQGWKPVQADQAWSQRMEQREKNYPRDIAEHIKDGIRHAFLDTPEKLIPEQGDKLTLKEILNDYQTPFMDAYEHSKQLKDGEPGKSKTLEEIVDRMKDCPWADQIRIKFDSNASNPEYDPFQSTITIKPGDQPDAQIALFAHEAYHATHQFLDKMYSGDKLDKQTFGKTLVWGEVGSMVSEAKVHDELKLGSDKPQFFYKRADGKDDHIDISDYEKQHGIKGLYDFLDTAKPARTNQEPYGVYYQKNYKAYADRFTQDRPNALMTIEKWVKSGHKAEDI